MDFIKFTILSVLFSLCSILQAFDSTPGIYVNHKKWLEYSRALPSSLKSQQILGLNDPRHFLKPNPLSCTECPGCPPTNGARQINEGTETPMSLLFLNLTDVTIPFKVVKDVLRLEPQDEQKVKFVTEKAVIFSFVNKTVLQNIKNTGRVERNEDPMIIALFLPVEYRLTNCNEKSLVGASRTPITVAAATDSEEKNAEWPQFFRILLKEMAESNVTSQNLLEALLDNAESNETPDTVSKETSYNDAVKLIKDHDFQDSDVMLYFFRTPHVGIPPKYVKQILKEVDIPLPSNGPSKFEVNEVYLMTVANETAGKELKEKLLSGKTKKSGKPEPTPVVLSFIIPIQFNPDRRGKSTLPRAKLTNTPPQFLADDVLKVNDSAVFVHQTPFNLAPAFSAPSLPAAPYITLPLLVPYEQVDINAETVKLINSIPKQYFQNLNATDREHLVRLLTNAVSANGYPVMDNVQSTANLHQGNQKPILAPPAYANAYEPQKAPPATAPGGINSSLQP